MRAGIASRGEVQADGVDGNKFLRQSSEYGIVLSGDLEYRRRQRQRSSFTGGKCVWECGLELGDTRRRIANRLCDLQRGWCRSRDQAVRPRRALWRRLGANGAMPRTFLSLGNIWTIRYWFKRGREIKRVPQMKKRVL